MVCVLSPSSIIARPCVNARFSWDSFAVFAFFRTDQVEGGFCVYRWAVVWVDNAAVDWYVRLQNTLV